MKDVEIDEAIRRNPVLLGVVERATKLFDEEIGPKAETVSAEWDRFETYEGIPLIRWRISDGSDSGTIHFTRPKFDRLTDGDLRFASLRIWGDLLQERSHKQMAKVQQMAQAIEGG